MSRSGMLILAVVAALGAQGCAQGGGSWFGRGAGSSAGTSTSMGSGSSSAGMSSSMGTSASMGGRSMGGMRDSAMTGGGETYSSGVGDIPGYGGVGMGSGMRDGMR